MNEDVYLCLSKTGKVDGEIVRVRDIAKVYCNDKNVVNRIKSLEVTGGLKNKGRLVISVLKVIEVILKVYPTATITNIGENDVVVYAVSQRNPVLEKILVCFSCIVVGVGSAFAIMAYNNDVGAVAFFRHIYELVLGYAAEGNKTLEASYSLGLFVGITAFYGHFGKKKFVKDPTPLEVQMKVYDGDLNTAIVEEKTALGEKLDVD